MKPLSIVKMAQFLSNMDAWLTDLDPELFTQTIREEWQHALIQRYVFKD
jgi:hypothetical protein